MEEPLNITALNDFIFCPVSIYFHILYDGMDKTMFQDTFQLNGTKAHETVDSKSFSSSKRVVSLEVYSEELGLIGKVDCYDAEKQMIVERKKKIKQVYDGYVFQLYAQCYALREMGYAVKGLMLHSMDDNRNYPIPLPEDDAAMREKFLSLIAQIQSFDMDAFVQDNPKKCANCIYAPYCDRENSNADKH